MFASVFEPAPARLVHKLAADEVLLDGWQRVGERDFRVATRWPREHRYYYGGPGGRAHPMLLVETVRQCLPLLSHVAFDVPLDHHLVWESFGLRIEPGALAAGGPRDGVEVEVHCDDVRVRAGRTTALALSFVIRRHEVRLATARTRFSIQAPAVYRRVRGEAVHRSSAQSRPVALPAPVSAYAVERGALSDVLLSATNRPDVWQLRVDTKHPIFFDHPGDHVPGALLLDAALQAARAAVREPAGTVSGLEIEAEFTAFVELGEVCLVQARRPADDASGPVPVRCPGRGPVRGRDTGHDHGSGHGPGHGDRRVRVDFTQRGSRPVFSAAVTLLHL